MALCRHRSVLRSCTKLRGTAGNHEDFILTNSSPSQDREAMWISTGTMDEAKDIYGTLAEIKWTDRYTHDRIVSEKYWFSINYTE